MTNSTSLSAVEGLQTLNSTNSTEQLATSVISLLQDFDFLLLEVKLVFSALAIIYVGSHAALRRPPSAVTPRKAKKGGKHDEDDDDDRFAQGLELSDAIMFPLLAAVMLIGLYYLIRWLNDPAIINKILRWYMSAMSIASVLSLYAHGMDVAASFVFPRFWRGRDGVLRRADQVSRTVVRCDDVGNASGDGSDRSPLPGLFGVVTISEKIKRMTWEARGLFTRKWVIKLFIHGMGEEKASIKFTHMLGLLMSLATALVYYSTSSKFLSNVLGYGMCYGSFMVLSPTDFLTGSLVLWGLFIYDIVMVFYTPYMITVATTLDVPIKLTFEAASRKSILGLGDIVIPGMVIAWALRLDLWLHYLGKLKYESTDLTIVEKDATSGELVRRSESKHREVKPVYLEAKGRWGEGAWTRGSMFLSRPRLLPPTLAATRFRKTYFTAAMVGYSLGMGVTLAMLLVFKRGQPALLYLVPGVLVSLVVTAAARGELKSLWRYTEDGSLDTVDVVVDLDGDGNAIKTIGTLEDGVVDTTKKKAEDDKKDAEKAVKEKKTADAHAKGHNVFLLSIDAAPETDE